jgi:UDPglucose 6-dehydrogenase
VVTPWDAFRALDLKRIKSLLAAPVVVDLRNIFDPEQVRSAGLEYTGVGR